jgi:hypothetical protein
VADVRILLISGSTSAVGQHGGAADGPALATDGITAEMYDGLAALPAFSPDEDERPPARPAT